MAVARSPIRREAIYAFVAIVCVIADQATKALARLYLVPGEPVPFIPGLLNLQLTVNTGAAFSLGEGFSWLFAIIAIVVVVALAVALWRSDDLPIHLCVFCGIIAGGAVGNLIDRMASGGVVDFFATAFMDFPIFNVADICIDVGIVLGFIGYLIWDSKRERDCSPSAGDEG